MKERLWQIGFLTALTCAFVLGGLIAQDSLAPKVLRAQRFELLDADSRLHAVIGFDSAKAARITIYDSAGKVAWTAPVSSQPPPESAAGAPKLPEQRQEDLGLVIYGCKLESDMIGTGHNPVGMPTGTKLLGWNATGYVRNDSGKTYKRVALQLCYFDGRGAQIGSGSVATSNLAPGGIWNFKVPAITTTLGQDKNVRSFTVANVEAN